jgi:hypothetical protein
VTEWPRDLNSIDDHFTDTGKMISGPWNNVFGPVIPEFHPGRIDRVGFPLFSGGAKSL